MSAIKTAVLCAALALAAAGCASTAPADKQSVDQAKQQELNQMEKVGQRNDFDKPLQ